MAVSPGESFRFQSAFRAQRQRLASGAADPHEDRDAQHVGGERGRREGGQEQEGGQEEKCRVFHGGVDFQWQNGIQRGKSWVAACLKSSTLFGDSVPSW